MANDVLKLIIPGRAVPKKNSSVLVRGRAVILPSKAFRAYEKHALQHIRAVMPGQFREPVTVKCKYWFATKQWWPDLVGLLQGTSDILEDAGVLENDRLIVDYDGSRIVGLDKFNPRAEIVIRELGNEYQSCDPYVLKKRTQSLF